jgi:glycosyltransferase involved in cell wall biosynthesis
MDMADSSDFNRSASSSDAWPLVSVCVPTYNRATMLKESLRTICAQRYAPLEILISDDASSDGTEALCRELASQDPRIRYVRHARRLGLYPNHNFCLDDARGEYVCLFHDDDQHHPELVASCAAFLTSHPEVGIVCPDWELLDESGQSVSVRDHDVPEIMAGLDYIDRTIRSGQSSIGCPGAMIRKSALGAVRFREDGPIGFADFVVWFQIAERAAVGHIGRRLWAYRIHSRSFSRRTIESLTQDYYENLNRYCDEHLSRWPDHDDRVARWRKDINRYLFWALAYELGLHFRKAGAGKRHRASDTQSVFEISEYTLTEEEVRRVRSQMASYRTGIGEAFAFWILETLQDLRLTLPLAWFTQHAGTVRHVLGLK